MTTHLSHLALALALVRVTVILTSCPTVPVVVAGSLATKFTLGSSTTYDNLENILKLIDHVVLFVKITKIKSKNYPYSLRGKLTIEIHLALPL
jgi:hypothetical protein